jgi:hypothetical protein
LIQRESITVHRLSKQSLKKNTATVTLTFAMKEASRRHSGNIKKIYPWLFIRQHNLPTIGQQKTQNAIFRSTQPAR